MNEIDEMCAEVFLKDQGRLFDEPVAETVDEAMEFLEDCFAQVFNSEKELRDFWREEGIDDEEMGCFRCIRSICFAGWQISLC